MYVPFSFIFQDCKIYIARLQDIYIARLQGINIAGLQDIYIARLQLKIMIFLLQDMQRITIPNIPRLHSKLRNQNPFSQSLLCWKRTWQRIIHIPLFAWKHLSRGWFFWIEPLSRRMREGRDRRPQAGEAPFVPARGNKRQQYVTSGNKVRQEATRGNKSKQKATRGSFCTYNKQIFAASNHTSHPTTLPSHHPTTMSPSHHLCVVSKRNSSIFVAIHLFHCDVHLEYCTIIAGSWIQWWWRWWVRVCGGDDKDDNDV